jgi:hypothetical protein
MDFHTDASAKPDFDAFLHGDDDIYIYTDAGNYTDPGPDRHCHSRPSPGKHNVRSLFSEPDGRVYAQGIFFKRRAAGFSGSRALYRLFQACQEIFLDAAGNYGKLFGCHKRG